MSDHPTPPEQVRAAAGRVRAALPLTTPRLRLREVTVQDAAAVHAYRSLPGVARHLGHPPLDRAGTVELLERWAGDEHAVSVAIEVDGIVAGDVRTWFRGCSAMAPATTEEVEAGLGYAVHPRWQGRGVATESVKAVVGLVLGPRQGAARRVTARVFSGAVGSSRLLERLRFIREGVERAAVLAPDGSQWWDDEWWSVLREEWRG